MIGLGSDKNHWKTIDWNGTLTKTINHSIVPKILPSLRSRHITSWMSQEETWYISLETFKQCENKKGHLGLQLFHGIDQFHLKEKLNIFSITNNTWVLPDVFLIIHLNAIQDNSQRSHFQMFLESFTWPVPNDSTTSLTSYGRIATLNLFLEYEKPALWRYFMYWGKILKIESVPGIWQK